MLRGYLFHVRLELAAEVDGVRAIVGLEEVAEVLDHDEGVVVRLEEPVCVVEVVLVDVLEGRLRLAPQVVAPLGHLEIDGGQGRICNSKIYCNSSAKLANSSNVWDFSEQPKDSDMKPQGEPLDGFPFLYTLSEKFIDFT